MDDQLNISSALLLIVGEPFSEDQKLLILAEITKGFKCWDTEETGININEELAQIANRASLGEEGSNVARNKPGERVIQHQSDKIAVEILINPLSQTVKNSIKKLLLSPSETKFIIYAGNAFQGSGAWVLQDDTFAFNNLAQIFKNVDVENALKQNIEANLTIHTLADSNWGTSISKADFTSHLRIQLNPQEKLDNIHGVVQFTAYIGSFLKVVPITNLLQASEQFGNIGFTRPTLYIFPGCQGDSALFGINGFNLLVNGGFNRRACFWDFARHLDRVDAMLMTHLGTDNIFGLNTVLQRKSLENIHPQIGYLYFNTVLSSVGGDGDTAPSQSSLLINLAEEACKMTQMAKQLGISPQPCLRSATGETCEPINLYHKLGHGSLDMYVLNPVADSKELKEFYQAWSKHSVNLGTSGPFPMQNVLSVCALLVWKPYNLDEKIVRIFLPGNAPQHKVIEGLEKVKSFGYLKLAACTNRDLIKPPPVKKPLAGAAKPGSSRPVKSTTSTRSDLANKPVSATRSEPIKRTVTSPTKAVKTIKEETNKKKLTTKEKSADNDTKKTERDQKGKPSSRPTSASPTKRPTSPVKASSPTKSKSLSKSPSPPKTSPIKSPVKAKAPDASESAAALPQSVNEDQIPVSNHVDSQPEAEQELIIVKDVANPIEPTQEKVSSVDIIVSSPVDKLMNESPQNQVNGADHFEAEEEEVKPQALPEPPIILESPSQDSETMPDYSSKIESDEQELSEFSRAEEELQDFESNKENISYSDPAQEIPSSPEPIPEEQSDYTYSAARQATGSFETPVFAHDGPEPVQHPSQPSMEQNIQYGIHDSSNGRDMGGIQEVDEEDQEDENNVSHNSLVEVEDNAEKYNESPIIEQIQDTISSQSEDTNASESQETDEIEEVKSDSRISAERQFEDAEVDDNSSVNSQPAVLDQGESISEEVHEEDSIDGDSPDGQSPNEVCSDDDKDVDESVGVLKINGTLPDSTSEATHGFQESGLNPFIIGADKSSEQLPYEPKENVESEDDLKEDTFNPEEKWGPPMGLPSPIHETGATSPQKSNGVDKRLSMTAKASTGRSGKIEESKKRPATAPASSRSAPARPGTASKRPPTGSSRASPLSSKLPPLPPMTPYYVDLTYIPNHGDPAYSDIEFFKRVRARYYVISALSPNTELLSSLMEAKATWEQKELEVTLIPTYESESLRHWFGLHKEKLQELRIDLTPAVSRCTIQLQDLETSLPAYRLEV
ncbi:microtubule-associated protein 1B-like isoform X1 [Biomphalaria glabrata]|uniref:Microtubule-associated protein 1B-like isoform X1 n=1 Tax=Biomphalaria glabrata TaxID=6526 RepID=A0A9U8EMV6_BIOGL|nr:microtubule-associated protein 1B-like isoform X1 [Biomphalaria glabrata]